MTFVGCWRAATWNMPRKQPLREANRGRSRTWAGTFSVNGRASCSRTVDLSCFRDQRERRKAMSAARQIRSSGTGDLPHPSRRNGQPGTSTARNCEWVRWSSEIFLVRRDGPPVTERIDDPLPPVPEQDPKRRLHDTIKCLNRNHRRKAIRFHGDGTGEGVCWEFLDAGPD